MQSFYISLLAIGCGTDQTKQVKIEWLVRRKTALNQNKESCQIFDTSVQQAGRKHDKNLKIVNQQMLYVPPAILRTDFKRNVSYFGEMITKIHNVFLADFEIKSIVDYFVYGQKRSYIQEDLRACNYDRPVS